MTQVRTSDLQRTSSYSLKRSMEHHLVLGQWRRRKGRFFRFYGKLPDCVGLAPSTSLQKVDVLPSCNIYELG